MSRTQEGEGFHAPCPYRILEELGSSFALGAVGGSCYHFIKRIYNSQGSQSCVQRFHDGLTAVRMNGPRMGGRFAVWCGLLSACECTMVYLRQKKDPWNSIISGAVAGGLLKVRKGVLPVATGALGGGILLAFFEGTNIMLTRFVKQKQLPPNYDDGAPLVQGREEAGRTPTWFDGTDKEVFESFESPVPPTFDFDSS